MRTGMNKMYFADKVRVMEYLKDNWSTLEFCTNVEIARQAGEKLTLAVSVSVISDCLKAAGLVRQKSKDKTPLQVSTREMLILCQELRKLQGALGVTPSAEFEEFIKRL